MSGRFLDIPNEKIVEDYRRLNLIPTCGEYFRSSYMGKEGNYCCPITCQMIAKNIITLEEVKEKYYLPAYRSSDVWPEFMEFNDSCWSNKTSFLNGFDSPELSSLYTDKDYFNKGRELRRLLFNSEKGAIS